MAPYSLRKGIQHSKARIGDTLGRRAARIQKGATGIFHGTVGVRTVRRAVKSYGSQEMMDSRQLTDAIKRMHKAARHLDADAKRLEKIYEKDEHPDVRDKRLDRLLDDFEEDLTTFTDSHRHFLISVNDMIQKEAQFEAFEDQGLLSLLERYAAAVERSEMVVSSRELDRAEHELHRFLARRAHDEKRTATEERREMKRGKVRALFHPGGSRLAHKLRKIYRKMRHAEMQDLKRNYATLIHQVDTGKIQPGWIDRFVLHVKNLEKLEKYHWKAHHDIDLLLESVLKEVKLAWDAMAIFIAKTRNLHSVSNGQIPEKVSEMRKMRDEVKEVLSSGVTDSRRLLKQLHREMPGAEELFRMVKEHSQHVMADIEHNPERFVQQAMGEPRAANDQREAA